MPECDNCKKYLLNYETKVRVVDFKDDVLPIASEYYCYQCYNDYMNRIVEPVKIKELEFSPWEQRIKIILEP